MWKYITGFLLACLVAVALQPADCARAAIKYLRPAVESEALLPEEDSPEPAQMLTYEQAVEKALQYSYQLRNQAKRTEQLEILKREAVAAMDFTTSPEMRVNWLLDMQQKNQLLNLVQLETDFAMSRRVEELGRESVALQVQAVFDEIVKLEEQLELHSTLLSNLEQRLEHTAIKAGRGLESVFNLEKMRREYQEQEHFQEVLRKSLDNAYLKLGALLGISDLAEYTILVEELLFEPMEPVNLELHIIRSIRNDPYIWLKEREIEKAEKSLWLYAYTGLEEPYSVRERNVQIAKNELAEMKNSLEENLRSRYNQILQLEENFLAASSRLARAEEALRAVRVRYELGMATELEVEEAAYAVAAIEHEMKEIALQHRMLVMLFNSPFLQPDYV